MNQGLHATSSYCLVGQLMRFLYFDDEGLTSFVAPVSTTSIETLFGCVVKKIVSSSVCHGGSAAPLGLSKRLLFATMPES